MDKKQSMNSIPTGTVYIASDMRHTKVVDLSNEWKLEIPFLDAIQGVEYYDAVVWASNNQIMSGIAPNPIVPGKSCTGAEIITFLWRTVGCPHPIAEEGNKAANSEEPMFSHSAVQWIRERVPTSSDEEIADLWEQVWRRHQLAYVLWLVSSQPRSDAPSVFHDVSPDHYAFKAVSWVAEHNLMPTSTGTLFSPESIATFGQVLLALYRFQMKML